MGVSFESVLQVYESRAQVESRLMRELPSEPVRERLNEFLLPVGRATGTLLNLLVKESQARRILEVGTSYGYSTLWLAEAAATVGGKVTTLELQQVKVDDARAQPETAQLAGYVEFRVGDAFATLASLPGAFDFVLVDLWNELNLRAIDLLYPKLAAGAFIVADNMLQPETGRGAAQAYRDHIRTKQGISTVLLAVGSGVELGRFR